jgi:hypothetical protein
LVQVTADDQTIGGTPEATSAVFTLNVNDLSELPTEITPVGALSVIENSATGTLAGVVQNQHAGNLPLTFALTNSVGALRDR